jgi:coenzyme PQQ synthesis protein D (PqqD)
MAKAKRSGASRFKHADTVSWRRVEDEVVILNLTTSAYFSLNQSGALIWERLGEGAELDAVQSAMCEKFSVAPEAAREDLEKLVALLLAKKLIASR